MKALKGILIGLIILLVVIVVAGGTLVGFNHSGHNMTAGNDTMNMGSSSDQNSDKNSTGSDNMSSMNGQDKTTDKAQNNTQQQTKVVVTKEQVPPSEYLAKMKEAQALIKEGTGLMASDPTMGGGNQTTSTDTKNQNNSNQQTHTNSGMEDIHKGIYKMAQGITLMDQAVEGMDKEIKTAQENNINLYQIPSGTPSPQYYGTYPYGYWVYPNQPQNSNQVPQANQNQMTDPNASNTQMNMNSSDSSTQMNHNSMSSTSSFLSMNNIIYVVYGFLFLSIIGAFVAVMGFIKSLFKPAKPQE